MSYKIYNIIFSTLLVLKKIANQNYNILLALIINSYQQWRSRSRCLPSVLPFLRKQMASLLANQVDEDQVVEKPKAAKKAKKEKKDKDSDDEKPKTKRISGYILYSKANRDDVKVELTNDEEKPKNTDIMCKLAENWKALSDEERAEWNAKAKEMKDAE